MPLAPIGSSRESLLTKVRDFFEIVWAFVVAIIAKLFARAETVRLGPRSFTVVKQLGEGGFSFVYLVRETTSGRSSGTLHALKRIRIQLPEHEARVKDEIAAHKAVNSPHVLKLLDSVVIRNVEGLLLLPYYVGGTVQDLIDTTPASSWVDFRTLLSISIDVCKGLIAFHSKNPPLAFRDLKPANILLDGMGRAVLMDLGSVCPARTTISTRKEALRLQELCAETVTAPFRAPELFEPSTGMDIDERSDVFAFGCTIYAMAWRTSPFDGSATAAVGGKVTFPQKPDPYGPHFRSLITSMVATNLQSRPTSTEVLTRLESLLGGIDGA